MPNWKKVIISGSDASLNSLSVTNSVTASGDILIEGNVGIGTTSPTQKLDVVGKIALNDGGGSVFIGTDAGLNDDASANSNVGIGYDALRNNTTGTSNTANGIASLRSNTTGGRNIANGAYSGNVIADGVTANTDANASIFLGYNTKALADNQTNQIVIGYSATGLGSNTAVLGNDSIVTTALKGNVGIGTTSPTEKLHVSGSARITDTFLAGKSALPNSNETTLASGSTSAITPNSTFAQNSTVGEVIVGYLAGADISMGQLVYLRHSGDWHLADASSTSTSLKILGIALKTNETGEPIDVLIDGVISMDSSYLTVSSIGEPLYVDTTAGKITNTAPSGGGEVVRIVGHYIKAETGYSIITFKPDGTWIEL